MLITRLITAAVLVAVLFAVSLWLPAWTMTAAITLLAPVAAFEYLRAVGDEDKKPIFAVSLASAVTIPIGCGLGYASLAAGIALVVVPIVCFLTAIMSYGTAKPVSVGSVMNGIFGGAVIPWCLAQLVRIRLIEPCGGAMVIMCFVISSLSDSGGYFGGRWFGKHRGVVKCSPNKTLEGFIGSFIGGIVGILIFGVIADKGFGISVDYPMLVLVGALGNVTTQVGDLAFSVIKREHGVKDYGSVFPGHGGVLDRFDSTVFTAPLIYLLVSNLQVLTK